MEIILLPTTITRIESKDSMALHSEFSIRVDNTRQLTDGYLKLRFVEMITTNTW